MIMMEYERKRKRPAEENPFVFFQVSARDKGIGEMVFELFQDAAPSYANNFFELCTAGERSRIGPFMELPLSYMNSYFLRIQQPCSFVKGGDFFNDLGICGESIYGMDFPYDVPTPRRGCDEKGLLCMNIADQYTRGSHFVITLEPDPSLDGLHVVFGKLVSGFATLDEIAADEYGSPFKVSKCGKYEGPVIPEGMCALNACILCSAPTVPRPITGKRPEFYVYLCVNSYQMCKSMLIKLYHDKAPLASENFRALCTGLRTSPRTDKVLTYMDSFFSMKSSDSSHVKGGTLGFTDEGVEGIYGPKFGPVVEENDEKHDRRGRLSISKKDLNASRASFIITLRPDKALDSSHIVFGEILEGEDVLMEIADFCSVLPTPIIGCGAYYH